MFFVKASNFINISVKLVVLGLLCYAFYLQLFSGGSFDAIRQAFLQNLDHLHLPYLVVAILLMPLNWLLETFKWRLLLRPDVELPLSTAYRAVLGGVTVSLFTPNRTGEYAGRILLVEARYNWKAAIATLVGSFSQIIVLTGMGIPGLIYFLTLVPDADYINWIWLLCIGVLPWGLLLLLYLRTPRLLAFLKRFPISDRWRNYLRPLSVIKYYSQRQLRQALGLSFLRYLVYSAQYLLVLALFGIKPDLLAGAAGVATIFLLQTGIPLPPFGALLARGELALLVWSVFGANEISILAATFLVFIINLSLPSLVGAVFIFRTNVLKSIGYDDKQ